MQVSFKSVFAKFVEVIKSFFQKSTSVKGRTGYVLGKMTIYGVISCITFDLDTAMIYWYDDVAHYSKGFQGAVVTIGWLFGLLAVISKSFVLFKTCILSRVTVLFSDYTIYECEP